MRDAEQPRRGARPRSRRPSPRPRPAASRPARRSRARPSRSGGRRRPRRGSGRRASRARRADAAIGSTRSAASSPVRTAPIIPEDAQKKRTSETRPTALVGLARRVIASSTLVVPSSVKGRWLTISSTTCAAARVVLQHDARDRDEDDRERHEREEDAVGDAGSVLREPVAEVAVDRHRAPRGRGSGRSRAATAPGARRRTAPRGRMPRPSRRSLGRGLRARRLRTNPAAAAS